jgi:flagellar basal-body rod modification protein FlgD
VADLINEIEKLQLAPPAPPERSKELDKDAFLKIFLAQLEAQDPLAPKDSAELSSQLAQFSQLEQSVNATTQLTKIGEKLDSLIELSRSGGSGALLDPVTLIGRQIEFAQNELRVPLSGASDELRANVTTGRSALSIQVEDPDTGALGLFSLAAGGEGQVVPLGSYRLRFVDGQPTLVGAGASGTIDFIRLLEQNGQLAEQRDESGQALPFAFTPGRRYRFSLQGIDLAGALEPVTITPTQTGVADSVRFVDGKPRIALGATEIGPEQIQRILDASR